MYTLTVIVLAVSMMQETSTQSSMKLLIRDQKSCTDIAELLIAKNVGHDLPGYNHRTIAYCKKES